MTRGTGRSTANRILWDCWLENARKAPDNEAVVHWVAGEEPYRWTRGELVNAASRFASRINAAGVKKGDVCAVIVRHHRDFYPLYLGVSAIGAIPAVLAYPNPRLHPDKFREGLVGMARRSGLDWILTETDLEPQVAPLALMKGSTVRGILMPLEWGVMTGKGATLSSTRWWIRRNHACSSTPPGRRACRRRCAVPPGSSRSRPTLWRRHRARGGRQDRELASPVSRHGS